VETLVVWFFRVEKESLVHGAHRQVWGEAVASAQLSSESVTTAQLTSSVLLKHLSTLLTLWASGLLHELEKKLLVSHD
jgi:hypothetical protein